MRLRIPVPDRVRNLRPAPAAGGAGTASAAAAQRLQAAAPQVVTLVLAAGIAAQLAVLAWKFVAPPPPAPSVAPPPAAQPAFDPSRLQAARLFGEVQQQAVSGAEAPRTNVALVLVGTMAVQDPAKGLAILGESAQTARVHAVGATLPGGVKLHSVYADRVVIDRGGALETLPLPRQFAAGTMIQSALPAAAAAEPSIAESVQKLVAAGPEVVGEVLRPMPAFANGQLQGFRLYPGRDRQKFARLGLQPGDLVTQVNGVPLTDGQRGMEILRSLGNAGSATVTVERGGNVQQLTVNTSQLAGVGQDAQPPSPDE
jgi:general secretion pathway protein C